MYKTIYHDEICKKIKANLIVICVSSSIFKVESCLKIAGKKKEEVKKRKCAYDKILERILYRTTWKRLQAVFFS